MAQSPYFVRSWFTERFYCWLYCHDILFDMDSRVQIKMNLSSQFWWSFSSLSELTSSFSSSESVWINWNWRSRAAISALDALTSFLLTSDGRLKGDDRSIEWDFHDRVDDSSDELLLNAFRSLSTKRVWKFKLVWLPDFAGFGGDVLLIEWLLVGLIISDDCDVRELTREKLLLKRPVADWTCCKFLCEGEPMKGSFCPGDVEYECDSDTLRDRPLFFLPVAIGRLFALFIL